MSQAHDNAVRVLEWEANRGGANATAAQSALDNLLSVETTIRDEREAFLNSEADAGRAVSTFDWPL